MSKSTGQIASAQVQAMQALQPAAAAWLLGITPRKLRDLPEAPMREDGTFEIKSLLQWWRDRNGEMMTREVWEFVHGPAYIERVFQS